MNCNSVRRRSLKEEIISTSPFCCEYSTEQGSGTSRTGWVSMHRTRSKGKKPQIRVFHCPECDGKLVAPKYTNHTQPGHIKTMYCFTCRTYRDFVQTE